MKTFTPVVWHAQVQSDGTRKGVFGQTPGHKLLKDQIWACRAQWERREFIVTPIPRERPNVPPISSRSFNQSILRWDLGVARRSVSLTMRVVRLAGCIALLFATGCGGDDLPPPDRVESLITVMDDSGTKREIPSSALIDRETGEPTVKQVLVIDRQSNKTLFVDAAELQQQSPARVRYVPVTKEPQ